MNEEEFTPQVMTEIEDFDLDAVHVAPDIDSMELWQEGNYLVGVNNGSKFRHRIPAGKILNRVDGKYTLKDQWKLAYEPPHIAPCNRITDSNSRRIATYGRKHNQGESWKTISQPTRKLQ